MGVGYNQINTSKNNFIKNTTQRPIIGYKVNDDINAQTYDGYFADEQKLGGGAWIEANRATDSKAGNVANNPNVFVCKKSSGTNVSGVLLHSYIAVNGIGETDGYVKAGQVFKWASLHSGVETYLAVHSSNAAGFSNTAVFPIPLTYDLTNGGVKVASEPDPIVCYAISNVIENCQMLNVESNGNASWKNTLGVKVRF